MAYCPLNPCRERFGPPPRKPSGPWQPFPNWLPLHLRIAEATCPLRAAYKDRGLLLREGQVVWGALIHANFRLYRRGVLDGAAACLYSLDPHFEQYPEELKLVAYELGAMKGTEPDDSEVNRLVAILTDEMIVEMKLPVPKVLAGEREIWYTTLNVTRGHLPSGRMLCGAFPLIVCPAKTEATMILPKHYWDPLLVKCWKSRCVTAVERVLGY